MMPLMHREPFPFLTLSPPAAGVKYAHTPEGLLVVFQRCASWSGPFAPDPPVTSSGKIPNHQMR
jgi:hypothetical protein